MFAPRDAGHKLHGETLSGDVCAGQTQAPGWTEVQNRTPGSALRCVQNRLHTARRQVEAGRASLKTERAKATARQGLQENTAIRTACAEGLDSRSGSQTGGSAQGAAKHGAREEEKPEAQGPVVRETRGPAAQQTPTRDAGAGPDGTAELGAPGRQGARDPAMTKRTHNLARGEWANDGMDERMGE